MSRPWRVGLVGCGYVADFHLEAWSRQPDAAVVALCDRDPTRLNRAARRFAIHQTFVDFQEMVASAPLDVIEICTRPESHEALIEASFARGRSVLCQKPIALDLETIDRLEQLERRSSARVMVHENWRFRPWYLEMERAVKHGVIGEPVRLRLQVHDGRALAPNGFADQPYFATMPRFILLEMGPHVIDLARRIMGEPDTVDAFATRAGSSIGEDGIHLVLTHPAPTHPAPTSGSGSRLSIIDVCWASSPEAGDRGAWGLFDTVVEGTKGTLRTTGDGGLRRTDPEGATQEIDVRLETDPRLQSYRATQRHFLDQLERGERFDTDLADARQTFRVISAGYRSAESGRRIRLDEIDCPTAPER